MNKKAGYAFRIVLGGYLAWLGIRMLIQLYNERPSNMVFMGIMSVIFTVIGGGYAIYSLKKVLELKKEEMGMTGEESAAQEETPEVIEVSDEKQTEVIEVSDEEQTEKADVQETVEETVKEEVENDYEEK